MSSKGLYGSEPNGESEAILGSDIRIDDDPNMDLFGADFIITNEGDMDVVSGDLNLGQAIAHRLRTSKGELAPLGHPEYGSTLYDYVGEPNDKTTRARLRLAIRDTIRQDPRVKEIVSISVRPRGNGSTFPNTLDIEIVLIPVGKTEAIQLAFPFNLEAE